MVKAYIVDYEIELRGRRRIQAILQWGGTESLNPRDVGLQSIDSIVLSPQYINAVPGGQAIPIGSVPVTLAGPGSGGFPNKARGQWTGSTVTLRWTAGSTGTRAANPARALGTVSSGTKTAHAWIFGI